MNVLYYIKSKITRGELNMIDLELLKTYAIDLLAQKTENGIGLEMLGEYTKTITNFIAFIDDIYK